MIRFATLCAALLAGACTSPPPDSQTGAQLFATYCASCHGVLGEGDGPVATVMQVSVPNLRSLAERAGGQFPRDAIAGYIDGRNLPVSHGNRQMPVWGNVFQWDEDQQPEAAARNRIASIVDFLVTLQYR